VSTKKIDIAAKLGVGLDTHNGGVVGMKMIKKLVNWVRSCIESDRKQTYDEWLERTGV
jgi:hypothetical protein